MTEETKQILGGVAFVSFAWTTVILHIVGCY